MKRITLILVTALFAVISFAQTGATKGFLTTSVLKNGVTKERILKPVTEMKKQAAPVKTKILGKKGPRKVAAIESIDELQGDFVIANEEYYSDGTNLLPADVAHSGNAVSLEVVDDNTIKIYGFSVDSNIESDAITATVDIENSQITIPVGQTLFTDATYGDITLVNVTSDGDLVGTIYEGGIIDIEDLWCGNLVYQGTNYRWDTYFHYSSLAPANAIMEYKARTTNNGAYTDQTLNTLVIQDEENSTVTIYGFSIWGLGVDIELYSDKTFVLSSDNAVLDGGSNGFYYVVGSTAGGSLSLNVPGTGTETTLTSDNYWSLYTYAGYWRFAQQPFTITLIDGSEFAYPVAETGNLVSPPAGLETKTYPFSATNWYDASQTAQGAYVSTVEVGWDGNDVYFQGLDKDIPNAWVMGTYDATSNEVVIPVTYTGEVDGSPHFFAAYAGTPDALELNYDADGDYFDYSATIMVYKGSATTAFNYFYNGVIIGERPVPVTPPAGLTTTDYPISGSHAVDSESDFVDDYTSTVKVGFDGNDVYIQGLFEDIPEGWVKGTLSGDKVTFAINQYVGDLSNGLSAYLVGSNGTAAGDVVLTYYAAEGGFLAETPIVLTRFKNSLSGYEEAYKAGATIGTVPALDPTGINDIKVEKAADNVWYNISGARIAQPTQKGVYIKNGKKYAVK